MIMLRYINVKGQFTLTCSSIYQSRYFCCELSSFGDIGCRYFCLLSTIMGVNGALIVVPKNTFEKLNSNVCDQKS